MTWSIAPTKVTRMEILDIPAPSYSEWTDEMEEQFEDAKYAARELAYSVGRPDDQVVVSLSGHVNPGHQPRPGWANDMITVTVTQPPEEQ